MPTANGGSGRAVKRVLLGFCRWTSVRGMPHVVRSDHPVMSKVWGVFVIIMLVSNIVLVGLLLKRYNEGNTIENIKTKRRASLPFPSVTVCNVDPVNTDKMRCLRNIAPHDNNFCKDVQGFGFVLKDFELANNLSMSSEKMTPVPEDRSKISILYQLIGKRTASAIGHQRDDLIIDEFCKVYYYEQNDIFDGNLYNQPCSMSNITYTPIINPHYFNCYRLTVNDHTFSKSIRKISMVLYLDEEEDLVCQPHCTHEVTEWLGAKVVVHPAYTYPEIEKQGLNLLPGASNQVLIKEVRKSDSINVPSAPCVDESKRSQLVDTSSDAVAQGVSLNYTDDLCISLKYQELIVKNCNCVDASVPMPTDLRETATKIPFCGNLSNANSKTMEGCKKKVKGKYGKSIYNDCKIPCKKLEYFVELTQLRWPQKPQILKYYKKFKDRVYYERKLQVYERIENLKNATKSLQELMKIDTFEKNFLQVEIIRAHFDVIHYQENEEYSLPTFLSQIGGICSIFLGVTFVTLLELFELVYRIYLAMKSEESAEINTETPAPENHLPHGKDAETIT